MADGNFQTAASIGTVEAWNQVHTDLAATRRFLEMAKVQRNEEADKALILAAQLKETNELVLRLDSLATARAATIADIELKLKAAEDLADERKLAVEEARERARGLADTLEASRETVVDLEQKLQAAEDVSGARIAELEGRLAAARIIPRERRSNPKSKAD